MAQNSGTLPCDPRSRSSGDEHLVTAAETSRRLARVVAGQGADGRFREDLLEIERIVVGAEGPTVRAGAPARLLPEHELADRHAPVDRLAHVVDRERGDGRRG